MDVGAVSAAGLRGTLAARDFAPGDTIIAVPFSLTVAIGGHNALASVRGLPAKAKGCVVFRQRGGRRGQTGPVVTSLLWPAPVSWVACELLTFTTEPYRCRGGGSQRAGDGWVALTKNTSRLKLI